MSWSDGTTSLDVNLRGSVAFTEDLTDVQSLSEGGSLKISDRSAIVPYVLTALIRRPKRLVYLSSNMHRGGRARTSGMDWTGGRETGSYSDSKLFVTVLALAVARRWPDVLSNTVDPGWVPTRMGGAGAPDDLTLGYRTQVWLAVSYDAAATVSGAFETLTDPAT